ncbi:protease HtpX [Thermodesulfovibrio hydrogeniphilus]
MKRILLFLATNIAVLFVLSLVLRILNVEPYLTSVGLNYQSLLIFAAVFGMGGAFINLALSKTFAKMLTGAQVIKTPSNDVERWLVRTVSELAQKSGIGMPEVAIYQSDDMNAFATGMRRNNALVAVSTGLLRRMNPEQIRAVLAHEIAHIKNGDMITLTLIQGVINTFVIFISRVAGYIVDRHILKNEEGYGIGYFVTTIITQILFGILTSIIVLWFSRMREYRADFGGAQLVGKKPMIQALESLKKAIDEPLPDQLRAFGIKGGKKGGFAALFATHPDLDDRIQALESKNLPEYIP